MRAKSNKWSLCGVALITIMMYGIMYTSGVIIVIGFTEIPAL